MINGDMLLKWGISVILTVIIVFESNSPSKADLKCSSKTQLLTDRQQIELVVKDILKNYPQVTQRQSKRNSQGEVAEGDWFIPPGEGDEAWKSVRMHKPSYPIPYKDIKEFFELNPNCCFVTKSYRSKYSEGGDRVTDDDRKSGRKSSIVVVMWSLRYKDNDGNQQTEILERYQAIDNCSNFAPEF